MNSYSYFPLSRIVQFSEIRCKKSAHSALEHCEFRENLRWVGRTLLIGVYEITVIFVS